MIYPPPKTAAQPETELGIGRGSGARDLALILVMTALGAAVTLHGFGLGANSLLEFVPGEFGAGLPGRGASVDVPEATDESPTDDEFPPDEIAPADGQEAVPPPLEPTWVPPPPIQDDVIQFDTPAPPVEPTPPTRGWPGGNIADPDPLPSPSEAGPTATPRAVITPGYPGIDSAVGRDNPYP